MLASPFGGAARPEILHLISLDVAIVFVESTRENVGAIIAAHKIQVVGVVSDPDRRALRNRRSVQRVVREPLARVERRTAPRLVIEQTIDGFAIAEADLKLRGPGEFLGGAQSGLPPFRFADLTEDRPLMELARDWARELKRAGKSAE